MNYKAIIAMIGGAALLFASCKKEEVYTLKVTPATATLYTDDALPVLSVTTDPASSIEGKTINYTSDHPEIVTVDTKGELKFAVKDIAQDQKVTITVTVGKQTATCALDIKAQIGRYKALSISGSDLQILDRNVGAKSATDPGNYYQWGKNTPVAYGNETSTNANYDANWSVTSLGFSDWTKEENQPCPLGWRMANADDMEEIGELIEDIAYWWLDIINYDDAADAFVTLNSMNIYATGKFQKDKDGKYLPDAGYFWAGLMDAKAGTACAFENNNFPVFTKKATFDMAMPVRCVK